MTWDRDIAGGGKAADWRTMKTLFSLCLAAGFFTTARRRAVPSYVDITWMSITNMYYELGPLHIVTDGYISRLPASVSSGASGDLGHTAAPQGHARSRRRSCDQVKLVRCLAAGRCYLATNRRRLAAGWRCLAANRRSLVVGWRCLAASWDRLAAGRRCLAASWDRLAGGWRHLATSWCRVAADRRCLVAG